MEGLTSIKFLPVCSNCLKIIWQTVDAKQDAVDMRWFFSPEKCPHCGNYIESITMPTKLPFDNEVTFTSKGDRI